jgi:DNA-binding PadR family transcriptional regulator
MEDVKFYSVTENGQELQMLKSLVEAAALWEISTTRRSVYEVTPEHDAQGHPISWTRIKEIPYEELTEIMRQARQ